MTTAGFLTEFPSIKTQEWEDAICRDLKGADYVHKLMWQSGEGFAAKPYYRAEDSAGLEQLNPVPGDFPYTRGTRATAGWNIREEILPIVLEEANCAAREAIASGVDEIAFSAARIGINICP